MTALTEQDVRRIVREEIAVTHQVEANLGGSIRDALKTADSVVEIGNPVGESSTQISEQCELLRHVLGRPSDVVGSVSRLESLGGCVEARRENSKCLPEVALGAHGSPSVGHPSVEEPRS